MIGIEIIIETSPKNNIEERVQVYMLEVDIS